LLLLLYVYKLYDIMLKKLLNIRGKKMKIGIISDVHSNILALEETFKKFDEENVEKIICIGDVIGIGPYPEKCVQFLMENKDKLLVFIRGNHENYLLNGIPRKNHNEKNAKPMTDEQISSHVWNHARLNQKQIEFIKNLKLTDTVEVEGVRIEIEHYPMDENNKFKKFIKNPNAEQIRKLFKEKEADIYLFGHTHQRIYFDINNKYYINPGSLGCPIKTNGANAGILEINNGKVEYRQITVKYHIEKVIGDIKRLKYPICKFIIKLFYKDK